MAEINDWDILAANNNSTPPAGWPENTMNYSEVNDTGREGMAVIARYFKDTNGSLTTAGVVNAYTLTLNSGYAAYFTGMHFVAAFSATNTGAATINVNGIGVIAITDRKGAALAAGELQNGGLYELRYDGTQFQLMGTVSGASDMTALIITDGTDPDLIDTNVPLNIGAVDPTTTQHLEAGPTAFQSKSNATTAAAMTFNKLGGDVDIGAQSGVGTVRLWQDGNTKVIGAAQGLNLFGSVAAVNPPTTESVQTSLALWDLDQVAKLGEVGFLGNNTIALNNTMRGGGFIISGLNSSGGAEIFMQGTMDGAVSMRYDNTVSLRSIAAGAEVLGTVNAADPPTTEAVDSVMRFIDADGSTILGHVGYPGTNVLRVKNIMYGGDMELSCKNTSGTDATILLGDPDGNTFIYRAGSQKLIVGANGIFVRGSVAAATPPTTEAMATSIELYDSDGSDVVGRIGFASVSTLRLQNFMHGQPIELRGENTAGTSTQMLITDPDTNVIMNYAGVQVARTITAASGGLQANNTFTGPGWERVLTTSDQPGGRGALVWQSGSQAIPTGVWTAVAYNTEDYDTDSIHSTATNTERLTVPVGVTRIRLDMYLSFSGAVTAGTNRLIRFVKNGTPGGIVGLPASFQEPPVTGNNRDKNLTSSIINVVAGDYFEIEVQHDAGVNVTISGGTSSRMYFAMQIVT